MQKKINITINDDLLKQVDERANELCLSRSAYITSALVTKLQSDELMKNLPVITQQMAQLSEKMDNYELAVNGQIKLGV